MRGQRCNLVTWPFDHARYAEELWRSYAKSGGPAHGRNGTSAASVMIAHFKGRRGDGNLYENMKWRRRAKRRVWSVQLKRMRVIRLSRECDQLSINDAKRYFHEPKR